MEVHADSADHPRPHRFDSGCFACVVDAHPRFHLEALRWFATLTEVAGVDATDLVVHAVGSGPSEVLDHLRDAGVVVRTVEPFDARSPHCNKIAGALRLAQDRVDGTAVLSDTDVVILEDPRGLAVTLGAIAGKTVDAPVPPIDVLRSVFDAAGIEPPAAVPLPWGPDQWTVAGNYNGGLYLVPAAQLAPLADTWARWARWLLDRSALLEQWTVHVDQVAMALALAAEGIGTDRLDVRWNTPTHDLTRIPPDAPAPSVLHYHQCVDADGLLRPTGSAAVDRQIAVANAAVATVWRSAAPRSTQRRWLEGAAATDGNDTPTVRSLLEILDPGTVLDAGHRAADPVADAPEGSGSVETGSSADVVLCLDPEGPGADARGQRARIEPLWRSATRALIIAGGQDGNGTDPDARGLLSATLVEVAPDAEIYPVGEGRGGGPIFAVLRPPPERHPRDYTQATIASLVDRHPDPLTLIALRLSAWRTIGFYPDHAPRVWEYPVVARLIHDSLPAGSRLVDIGAGVTPLAPYLSAQGYVVDTVDPSDIRRTWPPQPDWNEWDFLDYAGAGLAHRSWNCTLGDLPLTPFDGAYSVSVIEHLEADQRRSLLADISARVRNGGLVVLTIDLQRGSDALWNRNRGVQVEDPGRHGTFDGIVAEGAAVGLELFRQERVRDWGDVDVDIGLMAFHQTAEHAPGRWRHTRRRLAAKVRSLRV